MSLDILEDKYIFFINSFDLNSCEEKDIAVFLKEVFKILSEVYMIDLFGYFNVDIYVDENIGIYVEIMRINDIISYGKKIDTKVFLSNDSFYLKFKDLSKIIDCSPIYYHDNYYFISTKDVDNIIDVIEDCEIVYKDYSDFINNIVKI